MDHFIIYFSTYSIFSKIHTGYFLMRKPGDENRYKKWNWDKGQSTSFDP